MQVADFFNVALVSAPPDPEGEDILESWWYRSFRQPKSVHTALLRWVMRHAKLTRSLTINVHRLTLRGRIDTIAKAVVERLGAGIMEVRSTPQPRSVYLPHLPRGASARPSTLGAWIPHCQ